MKCQTPYCRNRRAKRRKVCHKCRMRRWRARNPMSAAFMTLRDHARERGIPFTIDRKTFVQFVSKNQYIDKRGLGAACLTIDRIDNRRGYEPGNIQPLTRSANSTKRAKQDMHRMRHGMSWAA